jgi:hypothetical protein
MLRLADEASDASAAFSASRRLFDLNGKAKLAVKIAAQSSRDDVRRFLQ